MRVIAIEEHFRAPAVAAALAQAGVSSPGTSDQAVIAARIAQLEDVGAGRIADMDAAGIDFQMLSHVPGIEDLPPERAEPLARAANDYLAEAVAASPDRLGGFASLPMASPSVAAEELERAVGQLGLRGALVNGHVNGRFLDAERFRPVFAVAARLGVPIYLHPRQPPASVRAAYYSGLDPLVASVLAAGGWGWHVDTGLQVLRLVVSAIFDELPELRLIVGHMGEALPFMLARSSRNLSEAQIAHPLEHYFRHNVYYTTSGMFSDPPLRCLLSVMGSERVMFSVDYPFSRNSDGAAFLRSAQLDADERERIAHANAEQLLGI